MSYASPYKGARRGYIYTTSGVRHATTAEGLAQTPQIAMSSVSSGVNTGGSSRGIVTGRMSTGVVMRTAVPVRGIYTSATSVTGGVTTYSHPHPGSVRKGGGVLPPGGENDDPLIVCPSCKDENGDGTCDICGCSIYCLNGESECACATDPYGPGYCWCPLELNWSAMVFMAVMAAAYAVWKRRTA